MDSQKCFLADGFRKSKELPLGAVECTRFLALQQMFHEFHLKERGCMAECFGYDRHGGPAGLDPWVVGMKPTDVGVCICYPRKKMG